MPDSHPEPVKHQIDNHTDYADDEIELIDLLRVIWKWKYLIIGGTVFCALAAIIVSFMMPKIYSIDTILEPGIINFISEGSNEGKRVYIDSAQNLKALIDVGSFNNEILKICKPVTESKKVLKYIKFQTSIPKNSNALKVSYETSNIEQGLLILNYLNKLVSEKYSQLVRYFKKSLYSKIMQKKTELSKISAEILKVKNDISTDQSKTDTLIKEKTNKIATIKANIGSKKNQIVNSQKRIKDIRLEIGRIAKNTDFLIEERNKLLASEKKDDNILSSVIYINTIQQNIAYSNNLKNQINDVNNQIVRDQVDIERFENEILNLDTQKKNLIKQTKYRTSSLQSEIKDFESQRNYTLEEIKTLEFRKDNVQNMQTLKPPTKSPDPIKPKKKLIVILATFIGGFVMIFAAFFLEYISRNKLQNASNDIEKK